MKYERKKRSGNRLFFFLVFFFTGGYLFFFSSMAWMPKSVAANLVTPLGEDTQWKNRTFRVIRWDYEESSGKMEVELDVSNDSYDGKNQYSYAAVDRAADKLKVETVMEKPDWIILQILGVDDDFGEMSLRIGMKGNDAEEEALRLYTNTHDVNRVSSLVKKDEIGYRSQRLQMDIENNQQVISKLESGIQKLQKESEEMQKEITRLKESIEYQTLEQQEDTLSRVNEIQGNCTANSDEIAKKQQEIEERKTRISLLEKEICELRK